MVYTDRDNFGDLSRSRQRQSDSVTLHDGDIFEPLLSGNFVTLSSVLIRKDVFDKLGGFSVTQQGVQDWDMWLRYSAEGGRVGLCREPLTRYRIHAEQMTNDTGQRAADREEQVAQSHRAQLGKGNCATDVGLVVAAGAALLIQGLAGVFVPGGHGARAEERA